MADTITPNYSWIKPEPSGSAFTWGTKWNANLDGIDAQVFENQNAGVPVGSVVMWMGIDATIPDNWIGLFGQALDTTADAALFAIFGYSYGGSGTNFNLPAMQGLFPIGTQDSTVVGVTGGEAQHILTTPEIPVHNHNVVDPLHNHGINQTPHTHPDPGHTHGVIDAGHAHGGVVRFGAGTFALGTNNPQIVGGSTDSSGSGITLAGAFANLQPALAVVSTVAAATGISLGNTGSDFGHNNIPPFMTVIYIIKRA